MQGLIIKLELSVPAALVEREKVQEKTSPYKPHVTRYAVLLFSRSLATAPVDKTT
jgi:hypothetical protein